MLRAQNHIHESKSRAVYNVPTTGSPLNDLARKEDMTGSINCMRSCLHDISETIYPKASNRLVTKLLNPKRRHAGNLTRQHHPEFRDVMSHEHMRLVEISILQGETLTNFHTVLALDLLNRAQHLFITCSFLGLSCS